MAAKSSRCGAVNFFQGKNLIRGTVPSSTKKEADESPESDSELDSY